MANNVIMHLYNKTNWIYSKNAKGHVVMLLGFILLCNINT